MNLMKSLYLGSAAGLVVMSGAHAADLPLKAKAVEYVKVCSLYGAGFYYIPGTDTCIKLGGYMRADLGVNTNTIFQGNTSIQPGAQNRMGNAFTWRARSDLTVDTRTATEYGVVRTFFEGVFTWTSGGYQGVRVGGTAYDGNPNGGVLGGQLGVFHAFIQFAGFTIGKAASQFSAPWGQYPGNVYDGLVGGGGALTGVNQFTYTTEFGNGVSASIGVQDPSAYYQPGIQNLSVFPARPRRRSMFGLPPFFGPVPYGTPCFGYGLSAYGGTTFPDIVGQLRVDQAWGMFQASLAAHHNNPAYYTGVETSGGPGGKWGWAGQGALTIKNIPTGPGDVINISGVYTNGATRYNIQDMTALAGANPSMAAAALAALVSALRPILSIFPTASFNWSRPGACAAPSPTTGVRTGAVRYSAPTQRSASPAKPSHICVVSPFRGPLVRVSPPATPISTSRRSVRTFAGRRSRT